jgi:Na+/H+-translocating membrane pyrophosphatase
LPGAIVSGVQMAISAANTGGAWDNAKKYIESGAMIDENGKKLKKELKSTKLQLLVIQSVIH